MPRKSIGDDAILKSVAKDFETLSQQRYALAKDAYEYQDDKTKAVIDRIAATLRQHASGTVKVKSTTDGKFYEITVSDETFGMNLLYLAVSIASDLAFCGVRIANFKFNPAVCASCGEPVKKTRARRTT